MPHREDPENRQQRTDKKVEVKSCEWYRCGGYCFRIGDIPESSLSGGKIRHEAERPGSDFFHLCGTGNLMAVDQKNVPFVEKKRFLFQKDGY